MEINPDDAWKYKITKEDVADEPVLRWFREEAQPPMLDEVALSFRDLALEVFHRLPRTPERTILLRKLVDAQDEASRASVMVPR